MRKAFTPIGSQLRCLLALVIGLFLISDQVNAQCGLSSFAGPGSPFTPTSSFQNTPPTGSGTYEEFNVVSGNIYSFYFTGLTAPVTNNYWDMTVSSTSAIIGYNNSISPIENSWTGGIGCPESPRPASAEWYSTYTGTVRINVKSWDNVNGCHDWVSGQGSAVLAYKECTPALDPGPGINNWNVEAYATTDITIPAAISNARYGTYVDNTSGTNFITTNYWAQNSNPSTASGWNGCQMPSNNFVLRARRQGFPCGAYNIVVNNAVNSIIIYVNGNQIYSGSNINSAVTVGQYALTGTDLVEIRTTDICTTAGGIANVSIAPITPTALSGGTIGGIANNSNICPGTVVGTFTNITGGSGGVSGYNNSAPLTYTWGLSTNGGASFTTVTGVTTDYWISNLTVPAGATYVIKRITTDQCGNRVPSNIITLFGRPAPNGSISPATQQICPGGTATLNFNFSPGTAPFNITYTNTINSYSLTNVANGGTAQVSPPYTLTYSFTSITDAYGCTTTSGFTAGASVVVSTPIVINNVVPGAVLCNGSSSGSITVNASGGQPPLTYSIDGGNTYQASSIFNNLAAGSYNVVVQDGLGCTQANGSAIVVSQPSAISQTLSKTDASCASVFDGSITVSASGGVPPYSYSLNGGPTQTNNVITGLQTGYYVVTVFDNNNCSDTMGIAVNTTYVVSLDTISTTDISCYGSGDGSLSVVLVGGIQPYQYSVNGLSFQSSGSFTGLIAANYTVIGRDSKGCSESVTVAITQPSQLIIAIDSITNVLCNGSGNGVIYTSTHGGTPGYQYMWTNGEISANDINVAGGTYNVIATDSRGCTATNGATVTTPAVLSLNVALVKNPACNGESTGSILVTANGGVAPYAYAWSNGATTQDIDSVPAGPYTVSVSDANGCQNTISQTLIDPAAITSSATSTNVTCAGAANGTATVSASGGSSPFTYLWSDFLVSPSISGLAGGTYYVIVTDNNGCKQRDSVTIGEPAPLVISDTVINISCFNANDGAVNVTVTGGALPYTFIWSNGATTQNLTNLSGGTISGTATDANQCSVSITVNIINPLEIAPAFVVKNLACYGDTDGVINLTISGGTPSYNYVWSNNATSAIINNLLPGTYIVTVTDSRGCTKVDSATVATPAALYTSGILKNVSCYGLCDGYIFTTPYGGTLPYSFRWSSGPSTENIVQLCGGSYFLTVTDANGCQVASLYIIHEPSALTTTITATNSASCSSTCTGTVAAVPTGGTTPYQYLWNNFSNDSMQTGLCAGHYTLLLTDSNGCHISDTASVNGGGGAMHTNVSISQPRCAGGSDGFISVAVTGGVVPYAYSWNTSPAQTGATATNLTAGTYVLTVTDSVNCSVTLSATLNNANPVTVATTSLSSRCNNNPNGIVVATASGGSAPYTYLLNGILQITDTFSGLSAAHYVVLVMDANGCQGTSSFDIGVTSSISVALSVTDQRILTGMETQLSAVATSDTTIIHYFWSPIAIDSANVFDYRNCSDTSNCSTPYVKPPFTTTFTVEVMNADSCFASDTITVYVDNQPESFLPTAFTPNGDGLNDRFAVTFLGASKIEVTIFNRWGEKIFSNPNQTNNLNAADGWDGTDHGKPAPEDTYVYQVNVTYFNGTVKNKAGTVTLVR